MARIDYKKVHAKLDNRMSENVQDIRQSHKIHYGNTEKQESEINSRGKNFSRGESPERHLLRHWA